MTSPDVRQRERPGRAPQARAARPHRASSAPAWTYALHTLGWIGAFAVVATVAVDTLPGQEVDREGFLVAYRLGSPWTTVAEDLRVALPVIGAVILAPLSATALRSGRGLTVARVGTLVLAAPVAARALRTVLDRPWLGVYGMPENTYPSGHVALTAAVAVGIVALLPRSVPRLPALTAAAGVTLAAAAAAVVSRAHRPADAVGALLLVAALGAASHCAAVLARALRRRQAPAG